MIGKQYYSFNLLTQYFQQINKPLVKEETMFKDQLAYWKEKISLLWTKPTSFVQDSITPTFKPVEPPEIEDFWSFEIRTGSWDDCGERVPTKHDFIFDEKGEGSWMDVLDQILDVMGKHYGYNIKEQVYYSVKFPLNIKCPYTGELFAGHGRSLNDDRLQLLLLAHPELYERGEAE